MASSNRPGMRKRRVSKQRAKVTMLDSFRGAGGGRLVFGVMAVVSLAYAAYGVMIVRQAGSAYAGVKIGAGREDVRYLFGAPAGGQALGDVWEYPSPTAQYDVRFGKDGRVARVACVAGVGQQASLCPPVLGVAPGTSEGEMLALLGPASAGGLVGAEKRYFYRGLGLTFRLAQQQVVAIEHHKAELGEDFVRNVVWQLLP